MSLFFIKIAHTFVIGWLVSTNDFICTISRYQDNALIAYIRQWTKTSRSKQNGKDSPCEKWLPNSVSVKEQWTVRTGGLEDWRTGGLWSRSPSRQPPWSPEWWWQWWFLLRTTSIESRKWRYPYVPSHNSKCNCFSDLYQSTLTCQNIASVDHQWCGGGFEFIRCNCSYTINIPYLTIKQL